MGTEERVGLPYWIWRVLPQIFEDKLPKRPGTGYERIGFMSDAGRPAQSRPIGTSFTPGRFARVGLNCATCHVGSYRETPTSPRQIVSGMPGNQMDLQGYANFLTACAQDPRFNYSTIMAAIRKENPNVSWLDRFLYRFVIRATKNGILERAQRECLVQHAPAARRRPRRHLQSVQSAAEGPPMTTRSAPSICRRCGISACVKGCRFTGTATTTRWKNETRAPRSAQARRPSRSIFRRWRASKSGSSTCGRRRIPPRASTRRSPPPERASTSRHARVAMRPTARASDE